MSQLEAFPNQQYMFLKGLLGPTMGNMGNMGGRGSYMDEERSREERSRGESRDVSGGMVEKYIELMCQLEPTAVYSYLPTNELYVGLLIGLWMIIGDCVECLLCLVVYWYLFEAFLAFLEVFFGGI